MISSKNAMKVTKRIFVHVNQMMVQKREGMHKVKKKKMKERKRRRKRRRSEIGKLFLQEVERFGGEVNERQRIKEEKKQTG